MVNLLSLKVVFTAGLFLHSVDLLHTAATAAAQPAAGFADGVRLEQVITFVQPPSPSDLRISALARANAVSLLRRSATFRELLATLRQDPRLRVYLDVGDTRGNGGRTDFQITPQRVTARIVLKSSSMTDTFAGMRIVAHELAHVYEVICLPAADSTAALRGVLISRGATRKHGGAYETEFARRVEEAVYGEWRVNAAESQLRRIAASFSLSCAGSR